MPYQIIQGDCLEKLKELPAESMQCCVTSPPYWGLRDYKVYGQIGLEGSLEDYIEKLVAVFNEVKRTLKSDGTLWLNMGDAYAGSWGNFGAREGQQRSRISDLWHRPAYENRHDKPPTVSGSGLKPKDLIGLPWILAFALRSDGWWLRSDIIWAKPNPMPESVQDRPTKAHEYLFLLSKSQKYYYDAEAIMENLSECTLNDNRLAKEDFTEKRPERNFPGSNGKGGGLLKPKRLDKQRGHSRRHAGFNDRWDGMSREEQSSYGRNKRTVWTIATHPFPEAHFATFPEDLVVPCVKAGSRPDDMVLDPFSGAGTTGLVALKLCRSYTGIELNPDYVEMSRKRIENELGTLIPF